jgi:hypothetical protein
MSRIETNIATISIPLEWLGGAAKTLTDDGDELANVEYSRGILELISEVLGYTTDNREEVADLLGYNHGVMYPNGIIPQSVLARTQNIY